MEELRNFIGGQWTDTAFDRRAELIDPSTGEVFATAPVSSETEVDAAFASAAEAFPGWRDSTPAERSLALLRIADAHRVPRRRAREGGVAEHRQADRADPVRRDPADGGPDPVLRGRGADAGGPLGGRVHVRVHLVHPARADRGVRRGDAVELPDDDGGVEVRARRWRRGTPWCSSRPTPRRIHPAAGRADGRRSCPPGVFNVVCGDRDTGRALVAQPGAADGVDHRQRPGRPGGGHRRRGRPQAGAPGTGRQGAGDRVRRRRPGQDRRGDRDRRLLQRGPGLHRRDPGAGRAADRRRPGRRAGRAGPRSRPWPARTCRTPTSAR